MEDWQKRNTGVSPLRFGRDDCGYLNVFGENAHAYETGHDATETWMRREEPEDQGRLDGGWVVDFGSFSPIAALEWRGYATVRAVEILRTNVPS